ncbi:MAG: PIN domain-containing protein [Acidobacteriota bacterium]
MGLILDSSVLIAAEKKTLDIIRLLQEESSGELIVIAAMTASELLHGYERAPAGKRRINRRNFVEEMLRRIPCIAFDLDEAREHARIWAALEAQGKRIGAHDLEIAAVCMAHNHRLATLNEHEFQRVPGLQLVDCRPYTKGVVCLIFYFVFWLVVLRAGGPN